MFSIVLFITVCCCCCGLAAVIWDWPAIQKIMVQFPDGTVCCCCFLEQELYNFQEYISCELLGGCSSNVVCRVAYMEGIKYMNLIEIGQAVIER